jgi:hypothetical protein
MRIIILFLIFSIIMVFPKDLRKEIDSLQREIRKIEIEKNYLDSLEAYLLKNPVDIWKTSRDRNQLMEMMSEDSLKDSSR